MAKQVREKEVADGRGPLKLNRFSDVVRLMHKAARLVTQAEGVVTCMREAVAKGRDAHGAPLLPLRSGSLCIQILAARLASGGIGGSSKKCRFNPFVRVKFGSVTHETHDVPRTFRPVWEDHPSFHFRTQRAKERHALRVEVRTFWEDSGEDLLLGACELDPSRIMHGELGDRRRRSVLLTDGVTEGELDLDVWFEPARMTARADGGRVHATAALVQHLEIHEGDSGEAETQGGKARHLAILKRLRQSQHLHEKIDHTMVRLAALGAVLPPQDEAEEEEQEEDDDNGFLTASPKPSRTRTVETVASSALRSASNSSKEEDGDPGGKPSRGGSAPSTLPTSPPQSARHRGGAGTTKTLRTSMGTLLSAPPTAPAPASSTPRIAAPGQRPFTTTSRQSLPWLQKDRQPLWSTGGLHGPLRLTKKAAIHHKQDKRAWHDRSITVGEFPRANLLDADALGEHGYLHLVEVARATKARLARKHHAALDMADALSNDFEDLKDLGDVLVASRSSLGALLDEETQALRDAGQFSDAAKQKTTILTTVHKVMLNTEARLEVQEESVEEQIQEMARLQHEALPDLLELLPEDERVSSFVGADLAEHLQRDFAHVAHAVRSKFRATINSFLEVMQLPTVSMLEELSREFEEKLLERKRRAPPELLDVVKRPGSVRKLTHTRGISGWIHPLPAKGRKPGSSQASGPSDVNDSGYWEKGGLGGGFPPPISRLHERLGGGGEAQRTPGTPRAAAEKSMQFLFSHVPSVQKLSGPLPSNLELEAR